MRLSNWTIDDVRKSLVRIKTLKADGKAVAAEGTGFPIFKDENSVYILTCYHVVRKKTMQDENFKLCVEAPGKSDPIEAIVAEATVAFTPGTESEVDLAVLRCPVTDLGHLGVFPLRKIMGQKHFSVVSYRRLMKSGAMTAPTLTLHTLESRGYDKKIQRLTLINGLETPVRPGHSGSPVIESDTGYAVAIVTDVTQDSQSEAKDSLILALPLDLLEENWTGIPDRLTIDLPLMTPVHPLAYDLVVGNPIQILLVAPDGFDNEIAIIRETVDRTRTSPAARDFPVELYRWAQPILPLGDFPAPPGINEFHGLVFIGGRGTGVPPEWKGLRREVKLMRDPDIPPKLQRRIMAYRLGEAAPAGTAVTGSAADDFLADLRPVDCSDNDFTERFWNDFQAEFLELVNLSRNPLTHRSSVPLRPRGEILPPYKGLRSYRSEDAKFFYGRASEVTELCRILARREHGLLAVVGPSGSGKSSLIRAGLLYRLKLNAIPGSARWKIVDLRLSSKEHEDRKPILALAQEFLSVPGIEGPENEPYESASSLAEDLEQRPDQVVAVVLSAEPPDTDTRLVVFVDQFEEIFTIVKEDNQRITFLACLSRLARTPRVNVVFTMREDFYPRLLSTDLASLVGSQQPFWLKTPNDSSLLNVIHLPAAVSGYRFEDDNLIIRILRDAGSGAGVLPLLSYALESLVKSVHPGTILTWSKYEEIGRVQGVIQKEADRVIARVDKTGELVRSLFRRLVHVGQDGTATKLSPVRFDSWTEQERELTQALAEKRLLVTSTEGPPDANGTRGSFVEIAHEALLNHWPVIKDWIKDRRTDLLLIQDVEAAALKWDHERRDVNQERKESPDAPGETRDRIDQLLWPQERLNEVDKAMEALGMSSSELSAATREFIRPERDRLLSELESDIGHKRRDAIGDRLAVLGDPRPGVGLRNGLPDILWCPVKGGPVSLTDSNGQLIDRFEVKPFDIAMYPVTLAQFNVFARSDVYKADEWWACLSGRSEKAYDQNPNTPNHPAQFVSWYEAIAFYKWLSEQFHYAVRLPTEWEWVQAATGGNEHYLYPWGVDWDPKKANHKGTETVDHVMAVGMYPQGRWPGGPCDMSGNMFEWCLNEFDNPKAFQESGNAHRTTRGGSFYRTESELRVRYRQRDNPHGTYPTNIGSGTGRIRAGIRLVRPGTA